MCEYCEGVEGKPLFSDGNFEIVIEPYSRCLRIGHSCGICGVWSCCRVSIYVCPKCGRDLKEILRCEQL